MNNTSNNKIKILKEHFKSISQDINAIKQPNRPLYLQYLDKKLPPNHPLIKILEEML